MVENLKEAVCVEPAARCHSRCRKEARSDDQAFYDPNDRIVCEMGVVCFRGVAALFAWGARVERAAIRR